MADQRSSAPGVPDVTGATVTESLGRRIAALRGKLGWTQQDLAERVGISRVAVSHLESGMSDPGERTVALLAGLFKLEPHELVVGTGYPMAKAERLPTVVARYTEVELQLVLLDNDLLWLEHVPRAAARSVLDTWVTKLALLQADCVDRHERASLEEAAGRLRRWRDDLAG